MRVLTADAFAAMQRQGRIKESANGHLIKITLPEPGGAFILDPVRAAQPGELAWDYQPAHGGSSWVEVVQC